MKDIKWWAARNEKARSVCGLLMTGNSGVEVIGLLNDGNRGHIGGVFRVDLQAARFEVLLVADFTIGIRLHLLVMGFMGYFWRAMWTVVFYFTSYRTRLKNDGQPRGEVHAKDTAAPRTFSTTDCC